MIDKPFDSIFGLEERCFELQAPLFQSNGGQLGVRLRRIQNWRKKTLTLAKIGIRQI
ncbi:MAG: hypothetical protein JWM11_463 [Planctomycetaceae bacterium]|nr:hypothetical protein [Planctomycetaceae bacterium]